MLTPSFRRAAIGTVLVQALLMPIVRAGAVEADQMADASAPVDNPKTPGPDVYAGRNFDLVPDMPDPLVMDVAFAPRPLPTPAPVAVAVLVSPGRIFTRDEDPAAARGPPAA